MNFSYLKILLYSNKNSPVPIVDIRNKFRMTRSEAHVLLSELKELGYIYYVGDTSFSTTYKSKTIIKSLMSQWIFKNLLAVIAIIISVIALFK